MYSQQISKLLIPSTFQADATFNYTAEYHHQQELDGDTTVTQPINVNVNINQVYDDFFFKKSANIFNTYYLENKQSYSEPRLDVAFYQYY